MEVEEASRKTKPEMTAHGQNNLLVIRLERGMNTNNSQLPRPIVFAIIFLERMGLGGSTSWEIHSKWLLLVSWDPSCLLFLQALCLTFVQFLPFSSLLSLDLPSHGGSHAFSGRDSVDSKRQSTMHGEYIALITLFFGWYHEPPTQTKQRKHHLCFDSFYVTEDRLLGKNN